MGVSRTGQSVCRYGKKCSRGRSQARALLEKASELWAMLAALCWDGPEEKLKQQFIRNPLLTVSTMLSTILRSRGLVPDAVAGHSLESIRPW